MDSLFLPWNELPPEKQKRAGQLVQEFRQRFSRPPMFLALAPGRVNLIGEHTDYNGYPVLPVALDRDILVLAAPRADALVVAHSTAEHLPPRTFSLQEPLVPEPAGDWANYVKAAAQLLTARSLSRGASLLIDSTVPMGAGLSSSSALVVGVGLALLAAAEAVEESRLALAEEFAEAERFVGTLSGGMDQACCLLGQRGQALRIDFFPLRVRSVPFLPDCRIVVCHSLVKAEKSAAARAAYNQRVWECAVAAKVLAFLIEKEAMPTVHRLADVERLVPSLSRRELLQLLSDYVPERPVSVEELARLLGSSANDLLPVASHYPLPIETPLPLLRRARHVLQEADRVELAERALRNGKIPALSQAMQASHASLRDDFEVSCPELDELVALATEGGALGARLTGAGFGGCTVQLVPASGVDEFFRWIDERFYRDRLPHATGFDTYRFAFVPGDGAKLFSCEAAAP